MYGLFALVEAVRQLRGEAANQVADAESRWSTPMAAPCRARRPRFSDAHYDGAIRPWPKPISSQRVRTAGGRARRRAQGLASGRSRRGESSTRWSSAPASIRRRSRTSSSAASARSASRASTSAATWCSPRRLPDSVPAVTIDRQCGSSQQALHFAAQAVMSGHPGRGHRRRGRKHDPGADGRCRSSSPMQAGIGIGPWSERSRSATASSEFSQFTGAEMIADEIRLRPRRSSTPSRSTATARRRRRPTAGAFEREIVPVAVIDAEDGSETLHTPRRGHSRRRFARRARRALKTLTDDGVITAGNASQICDGASAVLVGQRARAQGARPDAAGADRQSDGHRRRPGDHARGADPGHPPRARARRACASTRSTCTKSTRRSRRCRWPGSSEIGRRPGAAQRQWRRDRARPSARRDRRQADGDPGPRACAARGGRFGLQTMCEGGGIANVTIIESLH